jgi:hypothetical protein
VWADTVDACEIPEYDQVGCPPGSGPVVHALRADALEPLLTVRIPADGFGAAPAFLPDGTRLVVGGPTLAVIERRIGTVHESINRGSGFGAFTADHRSFITLDPANNGLRAFDFSPPPDIAPFREAVTQRTGDGTGNDVVGGRHALMTAGEPRRYGQAFSFDGEAAGLSFGRRLNADIAVTPSTYAAWIKPRRAKARLQHGVSHEHARLDLDLIESRRYFRCRHCGPYRFRETICGLSAIVTVALFGDPIAYSPDVNVRMTVSDPSAPEASGFGVTVTVAVA